MVFEELLKKILLRFLVNSAWSKKANYRRDLILRYATNRNVIIVVRNRGGYKGSGASVRSFATLSGFLSPRRLH